MKNKVRFLWLKSAAVSCTVMVNPSHTRRPSLGSGLLCLLLVFLIVGCAWRAVHHICSSRTSFIVCAHPSRSAFIRSTFCGRSEERRVGKERRCGWGDG